MIPVLLGALVACALAAATEAYVLIGRAQLLLTHAEQLLAAADTLLARVPSTTGPGTQVATARRKPSPVPRPVLGDDTPTTPMAVAIQSWADDEWRDRFDFSGRKARS